MPVPFSTVDPNVTTAIAAVGGAILIKLVEKWIGRRNDSMIEGERLRTELRAEIDRYREDNIRLERELAEWRSKYWEKRNGYDSDEIRISELETEVTDGAVQIKTLTDVVQHLQDDIKRLQDD